jgi:hypothetical protein
MGHHWRWVFELIVWVICGYAVLYGLAAIFGIVEVKVSGG